MKANVPKKLYYAPYGDIREDYPITDKDIEYVRKDAFIEKAVSYLSSQLFDWVHTLNPDQRSCSNVVTKQDFIDEFKNHMKGE